jgi:hypothetical protein
MSFGVSPGDLVMFLKWLWRLGNILKNEATESFRRCARTYEEFAELATRMTQAISSNSTLQQDHFLQSMLHRTQETLGEYLDKIDEFRPYLEREKGVKNKQGEKSPKEGKGKKKKKKKDASSWLKPAFAKIDWTRHAGTLDQLRQDIQGQLTTLKHMIDLHRCVRFFTSLRATARSANMTLTAPGTSAISRSPYFQAC